MEEQHQSTSKEITQPTTSEEVINRTDPHWLQKELEAILEKGMFKHD